MINELEKLKTFINEWLVNQKDTFCANEIKEFCILYNVDSEEEIEDIIELCFKKGLFNSNSESTSTKVKFLEESFLKFLNPKDDSNQENDKDSEQPFELFKKVEITDALENFKKSPSKIFEESFLEDLKINTVRQTSIEQYDFDEDNEDALFEDEDYGNDKEYDFEYDSDDYFSPEVDGEPSENDLLDDNSNDNVEDVYSGFIEELFGDEIHGLSNALSDIDPENVDEDEKYYVIQTSEASGLKKKKITNKSEKRINTSLLLSIEDEKGIEEFIKTVLCKFFNVINCREATYLIKQFSNNLKNDESFTFEKIYDLIFNYSMENDFENVDCPLYFYDRTVSEDYKLITHSYDDKQERYWNSWQAKINYYWKSKLGGYYD